MLPILYKMPQSSSPSNILISYSGHVDSQVVTNLFAEAEICLDSLGLAPGPKAKILGIMIEMLQNIVDHSASEGLENKPEASSFVLEKSKKGFTLSTANKVYSGIIPHFKKRMEYLNSLTRADMTKLYRDILKNGKPESETSGLGLIDIIRKSGNPISFKFVPLGNKFSILTVKAILQLN
jgi:hypothetical protein